MSEPVERLYAAIVRARDDDPASRTARLMREGLPKMVRKVVEEALEVGLEAMAGDRQRVVEESADLLYNLAVLWAAAGVRPSDVWAEMDWRERTLGMAEKVPKDLTRKVA